MHSDAVTYAYPVFSAECSQIHHIQLDSRDVQVLCSDSNGFLYQFVDVPKTTRSTVVMNSHAEMKDRFPLLTQYRRARGTAVPYAGERIAPKTLHRRLPRLSGCLEQLCGLTDDPSSN